MVNRETKKLFVASFTLAGTVIGAGILGLPYAFAKSGFFIGLFWLIFLSIILLFTKLCLGEVALRTKARHQLPGYAKKYLGKWGKRIMLFSIVFLIYSALLAYLIGEGQSFSILLTGGTKYAIIFGVMFWLAMTLLLREGLKGLKKIESWGVLAIILIIVFFAVWFLKDINTANLTQTNFSMFFFPFGITLFALLGFSAIPELKAEIKGSEKLMKKSIIIGSLIPFILYTIFSFIFIGILGKEVNEIATLSFGRIIPLLGIFTMLTSYFVLSFVLTDVFTFDLRDRKKRFLFVSIIPLALYLIISIFGLAGFVTVLGVGGSISGGLMGILILLMAIKSKKLGNRKPEYSMPINWFIITILSLIFIAGIVYELIF